MSEQSEERKGVALPNLNTVLLTVVLGLSAWTLNRVSTLSENMAVNNSRSASQDRDIDQMRTAIAQVTLEQQKLAVEIVRLQQDAVKK